MNIIEILEPLIGNCLRSPRDEQFKAKIKKIEEVIKLPTYTKEGLESKFAGIEELIGKSTGFLAMMGKSERSAILLQAIRESITSKEGEKVIEEICQAISPSGNELELIEPTIRAISSVGTGKSAADNQLPIGSALRTGAGDLETSTDMEGIIHAAPEKFTDAANEEQFLQWVALAVKNSIILAEKYDYKQIAIPFIGSVIFGGGTRSGDLITGGVDRAKLARVVVNSAVNQFKKAGLVDLFSKPTLHFIVWNGEPTIWEGKNLNEYFAEAVEEVKTKTGVGIEVNLVRFDHLTELTGIDALVNAANTNCVLGEGIAGAIARTADWDPTPRTGEPHGVKRGDIDREAANLIGIYNAIPRKEAGETVKKDQEIKKAGQEVLKNILDFCKRIKIKGLVEADLEADLADAVPGAEIETIINFQERQKLDFIATRIQSLTEKEKKKIDFITLIYEQLLEYEKAHQKMEASATDPTLVLDQLTVARSLAFDKYDQEYFLYLSEGQV